MLSWGRKLKLKLLHFGKMVVFIHNEVHWKPSRQQSAKRCVQAEENAVDRVAETVRIGSLATTGARPVKPLEQENFLIKCYIKFILQSKQQSQIVAGQWKQIPFQKTSGVRKTR